MLPSRRLRIPVAAVRRACYGGARRAVVPGFFREGAVHATRRRAARRRALAGCLSTEDYDREHDAPNGGLIQQLREKNQLESTLSNLSGCNCTVDLQPRLARVTVLPGPKGLPDADLLRRMMDRVTEMTGTPPAQQLFVAPGGRILASGGVPTP